MSDFQCPAKIGTGHILADCRLRLRLDGHAISIRLENQVHLHSLSVPEIAETRREAAVDPGLEDFRGDPGLEDRPSKGMIAQLTRVAYPKEVADEAPVVEVELRNRTNRLTAAWG